MTNEANLYYRFCTTDSSKKSLDFLLVLTELFSLCVTAETLRANID